MGNLLIISYYRRVKKIGFPKKIRLGSYKFVDDFVKCAISLVEKDRDLTDKD